MGTDFTLFQLLEFWDTLNINLLSILFSAILGAAIGFIVILIVEILLRNKILVQRKYKVLKLLAYIYMVLFPLLSAVCLSSWSAIHNTEKQLIANIPMYLGEEHSLFNKYLKKDIEEIIAAKYLELTGKQTIDNAMLATADFVKYTGMVEGEVELFLVKLLTQNSMVRNLIISKITSSLSYSLYLDEDIMDELMETQFQYLLDNGIFNTVIEKYIRNILGTLKMKIILLFPLGIAFPLVEIGIAHHLVKKKENRLV